MKNAKAIYEQRINKFIDHVNHNIDQTFKLDTLAEIAFFSPYHFHRIFTAITQETVNDFTNRVRLEKAARLLKFSTQSITDIAYNCGFSSTATFSRAFKQYFKLSPSAYKKGGEIQNSKIRKNLFPVSDYHCTMNEAELRAKFNVEIKTMPEQKIAYIRVANSFEDGVVIKAFAKLIEWAKTNHLYETGTFFGMSLDDPMVTPKEKYRYEVCMTIPDSFTIKSDNFIETMTLPKSQYAVLSVSGDFNLVATATQYLFNDWLIHSVYEPNHQPGLEIFRNKTKVCDWSHFELDLCLPIIPIKTITS